MLDEEKLEQTLKEIIIDLCEVLYRHGYRSVSIGAMMRVLGVQDDRAELHDDDVMGFDEDFLEQLAMHKIMRDIERGPNTPLH